MTKQPPKRSKANSSDLVGKLRVIGGDLRSRTLEFQTDPRTRPMKDRTREAMFNLLGSDLEGFIACDLFAGSGILAIEAISRGATAAVAIELLDRAASEIRSNATRLGVINKLIVHRGDTFKWHQDLPDQFRQMSLRIPAFLEDRWCVFVCPPYQLWETNLEEMTLLLEKWIDSAPVGSLFAVELDQTTPPEVLPIWIDWQKRLYRPALVAIGEKTELSASQAL
ncbi:MAG: RsmD family RNA methyltransferase [Planctomycetota bacterium]|nr:RsmD family RNA methyltransferase [Planctomycetota bacterium]